MTTTFFQQIDTLIDNKLINITVFKEDGQLIVSTMITEKGTLLPSVICRGTAEQLDNGYFLGLTSPLEQVNELFINNKAFQKGIEDAKKVPTKPKAKVESVATNDNKIDVINAVPKIDYEQVMKEIADLNGVCKYAEAIEILPKIEDFPDKKAELEKMLKELKWKKNQLFLL